MASLISFSYIRNLILIRAATNAVAMSMPVLAAVLAFVTYSLSGHVLEPDKIFTSLTLFTLLRLPLMMLPTSFSSIADAQNASERLYGVFEAELLDDTHVIEEDLKNAVEVKNASFTWDAPPPDTSGKMKKGGKGGQTSKRNSEIPSVGPEGAAQDAANVFKIKDISLSIPRGQLVAIVGPVGAGKTSLLQGMMGEMRKTSGSITFGGTLGYCSQSAWIQNATVRENVCFGRPFDEARYWKAVHDSCLGPDLDMLPNGDLTEVGEKGISLSGGQKQRLNICRAIYCDSDIQIFDVRILSLCCCTQCYTIDMQPIGSSVSSGCPRRQGCFRERPSQRFIWKDTNPCNTRTAFPTPGRLHLHCCRWTYH
jgi:ABC-type multidrug transport system fused ATPase/permease subunit